MNHQNLSSFVLDIKLLEFKCHKLAFEFLPDGYLVERVESSAISKSLKVIKPRCFNVVGCSTLEVWFHKSGIIAVIALSSLEIR